MRRTARGRRSCSASRAREPLNAGSPRSSCVRTPTTRIAGPASGPACSPPAPSARARPATTRSWPRGTVSRSPLWPRRRCCSTTRRSVTPPSRPPRCSSTSMAPERRQRVRRGHPATATAGRHAAVLEDHGCVAEAFIAVLGITGDPVWLDRARVLLDARARSLRRIPPAASTTPRTTPRRSWCGRRTSLTMPHPPARRPSVAALVAFAAVTGEHRYREAAEAGLASAAEVARQAPRFAGWSLAAAEAMLAGPAEVAVVGPRPERRRFAPSRPAADLTRRGRRGR